MAVSSTKKVFEEFNKNQLKIGALGERIKEIQTPKISFGKPEPLNIHPLKVAPNPILQTNILLESQSTQLEKISELIEAQAEQAVLLNEQTALLLSDSAESSKQAKIGVWIAVTGILLSAALSAYSIFSTPKFENLAHEILKTLNSIETIQIDNQKNSIDKKNHGVGPL